MPVARAKTVGAITLTALLGSTASAFAEPTKQECIQSNESAQELRRTGRLREARARLAVCLAESCPGPIRDDCDAMRLDVDAQMPTIIFETKDSTGNDVSAVRVTIDGVPFADHLDGRAIDVDPGEHVFGFEAPALARVEKRLVVRTREKDRRVAIVLGGSRTGALAPSETTPITSPDRTLAFVTFGVGGAGLLVGIVAGIVAGGKHSTLTSECDNSAGTCSPAYAGDLDSFHTWRTISTAGYVAGAVGIVAGGVLWLTATPKSTTTARIFVGAASAGVAGSF